MSSAVGETGGLLMIPSSGFLPEMNVFGEAYGGIAQGKKLSFESLRHRKGTPGKRGEICFQPLLFMGMEGLRSGKD